MWWDQRTLPNELRRLFSGSTKLFKTKTCQNSDLLLGDLFEVGKKRNCAERNGTLTKSRIFNVRENFAKTNQTVKPNLQGSLCKAPNETRT